jgi:hypothetical protein
MDKIGYSEDLYFKVGQLLGKFHNLTTNYLDDQWFRLNFIPISVECWDYLHNEFQIQQQLGTIKSENLVICQQVFEEFNRTVLQNRHKFEQG